MNKDEKGPGHEPKPEQPKELKKRTYEPPAIKEKLKIGEERKGLGAFYDMHELMKEDGRIAERVYKELHVDIAFERDDAAKLFAEHEREYNRIAKYLPEHLIAQSIYVVDQDLKDIFEEIKRKDKDLNAYKTVFWSNANVFLGGRMGKDMPINVEFIGKALKKIGERREKKADKRFVGAIIQERINGISFGELFERGDFKNDPKFEELQLNTKQLLEGLRAFHRETPQSSFMWNKLESDNVMVELDDQNMLTGRVVVIDTNAAVRMNKMSKRTWDRRSEKNIFSPIEKELGIKKHPSFDEQYDNNQVIRVLGGKLEYKEIQPEDPKTDVPVIFAPGWGGRLSRSTRAFLKTLANNGRGSIAIESPRTVKEVSENIPSQVKEAAPIEQVHKAAALLELLDHKGIEKTDVFAHSEGAIYTLLAAAAQPERFRNIILSNPAGLIGKDDLFALLKRQREGLPGEPGPAFPGEKEKKPRAKILKGEGPLGLLFRLPKAFKDLESIAESDVHDILKYLHEQGVSVAIMAGVDDPTFPMHRLQATLKKAYERGEIDGFLSLRGGHEELLDHPTTYANTAEQMYTALEVKKSRPQKPI